MAQKNRSDLKSYSRSLIVESQTSEQITPEDHNLVNDEMIDSVLNAIDDLAGAGDFTTPNALTKKYISPYQAFLYLLRKSDKATITEVLAGINDSKYITPKSFAAALLGEYGLRDYIDSGITYAEGTGCFYDDGDGFKLKRCINPAGTTGTFVPEDWEDVSGAVGSEPYEEEITCDGSTETYTITHGKNTYSPIIALWYLKLDGGVGFDAWMPLDVTSGIYVNSTDPDSFFFNPTVYAGITSGLKYKIRVI